MFVIHKVHDIAICISSRYLYMYNLCSETFWVNRKVVDLLLALAVQIFNILLDNYTYHNLASDMYNHISNQPYF